LSLLGKKFPFLLFFLSQLEVFFSSPDVWVGSPRIKTFGQSFWWVTIWCHFQQATFAGLEIDRHTVFCFEIFLGGISFSY
jgi:hypothetical protein